MLLTVVTCHFLVSWFYFQLSQNFLFPFVVQKVAPGCSSKKFISFVVNLFYAFFFLRTEISLPYKKWGRPVHYVRAFIVVNFWTESWCKSAV